MIKKTIKYVDYDDNERVEDHYFNISRAEATEMEVSAEGGMKKMIEKIVAEKDVRRIMDIFKELIMKSYGVKSPDGKRFIKNEEVLNNFMQTEAYTELFVELSGDEQKAIEFMNGIIPKAKVENKHPALHK